MQGKGPKNSAVRASRAFTLAGAKECEGKRLVLLISLRYGGGMVRGKKAVVEPALS